MLKKIVKMLRLIKKVPRKYMNGPLATTLYPTYSEPNPIQKLKPDMLAMKIELTALDLKPYLSS